MLTEVLVKYYFHIWHRRGEFRYFEGFRLFNVYFPIVRRAPYWAAAAQAYLAREGEKILKIFLMLMMPELKV